MASTHGPIHPTSLTPRPRSFSPPLKMKTASRWPVQSISKYIFATEKLCRSAMSLDWDANRCSVFLEQLINTPVLCPVLVRGADLAHRRRCNQFARRAEAFADERE